MLVGRNAHARLWPQLADWMLAQARAAPPAADGVQRGVPVREER
jgi:hypothetical protein